MYLVAMWKTCLLNLINWKVFAKSFNHKFFLLISRWDLELKFINLRQDGWGICNKISLTKPVFYKAGEDRERLSMKVLVRLSYDIQKKIAILILKTNSQVETTVRTQEQITTRRRKSQDWGTQKRKHDLMMDDTSRRGYQILLWIKKIVEQEPVICKYYQKVGHAWGKCKLGLD